MAILVAKIDSEVFRDMERLYRYAAGRQTLAMRGNARLAGGPAHTVTVKGITSNEHQQKLWFCGV